MQRVKLSYKKKAIICRVGEQEIYGVAFIPQPRRRTPLAIFAHELGANHNSGVPYAEMLAESGVAAYTFDFRGGSATSRSDGSTDSMSVMTEAEDICAVLDAAKTWDFVDSDRIVLFGASQGGAASAIAAARRQDEICALMLLYPALVTYEAVHETYNSLDEVPEEFWVGDLIHVGRRFVSDSWDHDIFADMPGFKKPVLLLHGDEDEVIDISYSEQAAGAYPDCEFHVIHGAGHGFKDARFDEAAGYICNFLRSHGLLPTEAKGRPGGPHLIVISQKTSFPDEVKPHNVTDKASRKCYYSNNDA